MAKTPSDKARSRIKAKDNWEAIRDMLDKQHVKESNARKQKKVKAIIEDFKHGRR